MADSSIPLPKDPDPDPEQYANKKDDYDLYDRSSLYAKGESIRSEWKRTADHNLSLEVGLNTIRDFDSNDGADEKFDDNANPPDKYCMPKDLDLGALLAKERRMRKILLLACFFLTITCFALILDESRRISAKSNESESVSYYANMRPEISNRFENTAAQKFENEILGGEYPLDDASSPSQVSKRQDNDLGYNAGAVDGIDSPEILSDEYSSEERLSEGQLSEGQLSEGQLSEGQLLGGQVVSDEQVPDEQLLGTQQALEQQLSEQQIIEQQPSEQQITEQQLAEQQLSEQQLSEQHISEQQPLSDEYLSGEELSEGQLSEGQVVFHEQVPDEQLLGAQQALDQQIIEQQPSEQQIIEQQLSEQQVLEQQVLEQQLSEQQQVFEQQQEQVYEGVVETADRNDILLENNQESSGLAAENTIVAEEIEETEPTGRNEEARMRVSANPLFGGNNPFFENVKESSGIEAENTNVVGDLSQWEETPDSSPDGGSDIYSLSSVEDPLMSSMVSSDLPLPIHSKFRSLNTFDIGEQPYGKDFPFLWYIPKSGSNLIKNILEKCYVLMDDTMEGGGEDSVEDDQSYNPPKVAISKNLNQVSDFFRNDNNLELDIDQQQLGRCFAIFRNPIERAVSIFYQLQSTTDRWKNAPIDSYANSVECENNWMVRELTGKLGGGQLTLDNLAQAKNFIRDYCVIGLQEELAESIGRFESKFGWRSHDAQPDGSSLCIDRALQFGEIDPPNYEKYHEDSYVHSLFLGKNYFDIELYRYATQLFAQRST